MVEQSAEKVSKIAILSVYNKTGLAELATGLVKQNVRLIASGGTAKILRESGFEVGDVSALTGQKELLGGRVKTLHPVVHAGILARNMEADEHDLLEQNINKIDFVICNLYPFEDQVAGGCTIPEAVEEIDIGGVTLIRAAAKNHTEHPTVLTNPADYHDFLDEISKGDISESSRQKYALKAFEYIAGYDAVIADFFRKNYGQDQLIPLRYGTNPHQSLALAYMKEAPLPFKVLNGSPGYINLLDALNAWPLVKELKIALGLPTAASFKHVSPAGAAIGVPLNERERKVYMVDDIGGITTSALAMAYARARGADRMSSFGDFVALSDVVDLPTAKIISREVSDGIIAPGYEPEALEILSRKKGGKYLILQMDASYDPPRAEERIVYGVTLAQLRNDATIDPSQTFNKIRVPKAATAPLLESAVRDLTVASIATKYSQSNSVCFAFNGQVIGLGAGQQSRIGCVRLAAQKADNWHMRFHERALNLVFKKGVKRPDKSNAIDLLCSGLVPEDGFEREEFDRMFEEAPQPFTSDERKAFLKTLKGVSVCSDAFFPFTDNVARLQRTGVEYVAAPTGSQNDQAVFDYCERLGITFVELSHRLFHH